VLLWSTPELRASTYGYIDVAALPALHHCRHCVALPALIACFFTTYDELGARPDVSILFPGMASPSPFSYWERA
jgi:hypothetical protein